MGAAVLGTLCGCGVGPATQATNGLVALSGVLHGGQQAVVGSQIFLYEVGKTGNGSAATDLLAANGHTVTSGAGGAFTITGDYSCKNGSDPVYLMAIGGDPGIGASNTGIAMAAALGNCSALLSSGGQKLLMVDEVTTAAAAWALGGFATGPANVGASATNSVGIANAMNNAALLADTTTGLAASPSNRTIEAAKLYSLANTLAACVNSLTGSMACTTLFADSLSTAGVKPADIFTAAVNIVRNPSQNVAALYGLGVPAGPFTGLSNAPNDWTMSSIINVSSGSKFLTQLAVDANGYVWVPDAGQSVLYGLNPQGQPITGSPFGSSALFNNNEGVTVDTAGNVWVSNLGTGPEVMPNSNDGFLVKLQSSTGASPGAVITNSGNSSNYFYDSSINQPGTVTSDSNGNIVMDNQRYGTATVYDSSGTLVSTFSTTDSSLEYLPDLTHGYWALSDYAGLYQVGHLVGGPSTYTTTYTTCCSYYPRVGATDKSGNLWLVWEAAQVSAVSNSNTLAVNKQTPATYGSTSRNFWFSVAVDAAQVVWVAGEYNLNTSSPYIGEFSVLSSGAADSGQGTQTAGTALSTTGLGIDAGIGYVNWISPDASGNLWMVDGGSNRIVQFFGLATPTKTPILPTPTAP